MTENHRQVPLESISVVGRDGKSRVVPRLAYTRTEEAQQAANERRLGSFADIPLVRDLALLPIFQAKQANIVCNYFNARRIVATQLRVSDRIHKDLTGTDILSNYLDKSEEGNSTSLLEGYLSFPQLFIFFGYVEAPNRYLPSLLVQLIGQRYHGGHQVWLFSPRILAQMSQVWSEVLLNLSYLPVFKVDLEDGQVGPDIVHQAPTKLPSIDHPADISESKEQYRRGGYRRNDKDDPKLRKPKGS